MIILNKINKTYQKDVVLKDFNYIFENHGFYLLFGPSGCGKTTLLNLIAGILNADSGSIQYPFEDSVMNHMAYIMQDSYFIDYLTMEENLQLTCKEQSDIELLAEKFNVLDKLKQLPEQLSGGEKQRFSILQALLTQKNIILLDEPTASLDKENKKVIFEILKQLKRNILIICVSHDVCAKEYCDYIIDFHKLEKYQATILDMTIEKENSVKPFIRKKIFPYVSLQKRKKERYSLFLFSIILIIGFLIVSFSLNPNEKLMEMLGDTYHSNYAVAYVPIDEVSNIKNQYKSIVDTVYPLNYGAKYFEDEQKDGNSAIVEVPQYAHSLTFETLPLSGFYYHDHIVAGSYFTKKNEIMLGIHYAKSLNENFEQLIGTEIKLPMPNGVEKFKVAGVFKEFGKNENYYLQTAYSIQNINDNIFFNEEYTNQYLYDDKMSSYEIQGASKGKSKMIIYFDSFSNMMDFYEKNEVYEINDAEHIYVVPISDRFQDIMSTFRSISIILVPTSLVAILFSSLFYVFSRKQYFINSLRNICVYQYYGYSWNVVVRAQIVYILREIVGSVSIGVVMSMFTAFILNQINKIFHFFPFYPFTMNLIPIVLTAIVIVCFVTSILMLNFKAINKTRWYDLLKVRRDLL